MRSICLLLLLSAAMARSESRLPGFTAYLEPESGPARISSQRGVIGRTDPVQQVLWFADLKRAGRLEAAALVRLAPGRTSKLRLTVGERSSEATATGGEDGEPARVSFGEFEVSPGWRRMVLSSLNAKGEPAGEVEGLVLSGPAAEEAQFNPEPRRNASSVHLRYPQADGLEVAGFYSEVTGVEDPTATFYMACGFSRGYFGMQVNSATERRIIFSVWDAGKGGNAMKRDEVPLDDQVQLLAKGEEVVASAFGGEGTGGHSHLKYPWKTGEAQRFYVTAKPESGQTEYTGWWYDPEKQRWRLVASFRAPRDGKWLRGLHGFSENFNGGNGHLLRRSLHGPTWIRTAQGEWREMTEAAFSHDPTGRTARLDRWMGVEGGRFFLAHGGFVAGTTRYGDKFQRPASGTPPKIELPPLR